MFDPNENVQLPTVAELLTFEEVLAGEPETFASDSALAAPVRWAHVVAGSSAPSLLDGGELVLTTGAGFPTGGRELEQFAHSLADAGITAFVLELGTHFAKAPRELSSVLRNRGIAFIVLHRVVRFVHITQRIHRRILSAQHEALQSRDRIHRLFTELGLNRSPADFMVAEMATAIGAPVVLENVAGQVVAWSASDPSVEAADVLEPWTRGTYIAPASRPRGLEPVIRVPVEAQGTRWGTLTALPGPAHAAGRQTVLELGAIALALGRLASADRDEWLDLSSKQLFDMLLGGRYRNDANLETQLTAAGLPFEGRTLFGLTLTGRGSFGSHITLERAVLETALRRTVAPEGRTILTDTTGDSGVSLMALVSLPEHSPLTDAHALAERLDRELSMLVPTTTPAEWRAHVSVGIRTDSRSARRVRALLTSIEGVRRAGILAPATTTGRVTMQEADLQPLAYLLRDIAGTPSLQEYVGAVLGPLIDHDRMQGPGHTGDLLRVLSAYLTHPTNRSLAATQSGLSRSVFYQRLDLITELLGVDLTDGETIATLSVALMAHGIHS